MSCIWKKMYCYRSLCQLYPPVCDHRSEVRFEQTRPKPRTYLSVITSRLRIPRVKEGRADRTIVRMTGKSPEIGNGGSRCASFVQCIAHINMLWATFHIRAPTGNNPMMVPGLPKIAESTALTRFALVLLVVLMEVGVRHITF